MSPELTSPSFFALIAAAVGLGYCTGRLHQLSNAEKQAARWYHAYRQVLDKMRARQ